MENTHTIYGNVQPQAIDFEEVVLGAILLDKDAIIAVMDILSPESFYKIEHSKIYKAMLGLFESTQPIEVISVIEKLRKSNELEIIGGIAYILSLSNKVSSSANIEFHARIVAQKFIQRELIRVSTTVIKDSFEDTKDVFDLLDSAEKGLYEITDKNMRRGYESIASVLHKAEKQVEIASNNVTGVNGVPSGFPDLDKITSGWQNSNLIIVAARPAMGKTSFVLSLARNAALDYRKPVALFSLEMSSIELANRLISMEGEIEGSHIKNGRMDDTEWIKFNTSIKSLSEAPIFIDDTASLNVFELRAKCRRLYQHHNISMVVIDYLQLMTAGGTEKKNNNREQEISYISRALKGLAKEINIPVIALSQLSRAAESGSTKKPQLSHLRESGAIEQDADMVLFIYRPDYYDTDIQGDVPKGYTELIIAKHRHGSTGTVAMKFIDTFAKFIPLNSFNESVTSDYIIKNHESDLEIIPF